MSPLSCISSLSLSSLPSSTRISRPMLSTFPASMLPDVKLENLFPPFENEYAPWICSDIFPEPILRSPEPIASSPDSLDSQNHRPPSHNRPKTLKAVVDERKWRRMASNRESARRSRMRKQQYLENLRGEANRLRVMNRKLTNWLRVVSHLINLLQTENDRLHAEHTLLQQSLIEMKHDVRFGMLP